MLMRGWGGRVAMLMLMLMLYLMLAGSLLKERGWAFVSLPLGKPRTVQQVYSDLSLLICWHKFQLSHVWILGQRRGIGYSMCSCPQYRPFLGLDLPLPWHSPCPPLPHSQRCWEPLLPALALEPALDGVPYCTGTNRMEFPLFPCCRHMLYSTFAIVTEGAAVASSAQCQHRIILSASKERDNWRLAPFISIRLASK